MPGFAHEFPLAPSLRYLNHAAVAPWPQRSAMAVQQFSQANVRHGASDYANWLKLEKRLRERLMRLLNASTTGDIALVKNTSEALSFVGFGLDWRPGDQVVISDEEFPSNRIVWQALARFGVEVVEVSLKGADPEAALLAAFTPRTRLLAVSAVQFSSGLRLDLARLGQGCRRHGVLFCIDAIQQLGATVFDVQAYDCHFAMADGHKWMLGPEGLGVFYCRADVRDQLKLSEYGWHMLEHAGDYTRTTWEPARSARRFECGSPNMLGAFALEASLSLLEEVGMDEVQRLLEARVDQLSQGLAALPGATVHSPMAAARRAGIVNFSLAGWDNAALHATLREANVIGIPRGPGVRLSPHFYTPESVIEDTLAEIERLARC